MRNGNRGVPWALVAGMVALSNGLLAEDMPMLCPQPQEARLLPEAGPLDLSAGMALKVPKAPKRPVQLAGERLQAELERRGNRQQAAAAPATICIGGVEDYTTGELKGLAPEDMVAAAAELPAEGYLLTASAPGVVIVGRDVRGTVYGVETLIQLARQAAPIPAVAIRDYPDLAWRMTYCAGGNHLDERLKSIVRHCVSYKLNMIVFENPDFYRLEDPEVKERLRAVFTYCEEMGIEPIPELQSFGWSQYILPLDPLCVEAIPFKDRHFQFGDNGIAQPYYKPGPDLTILNAGLDRADGNRLADWQQDDTGVTIFSEPSEKGGRCLKIQRQTPGVSRISQRVTCAPNTGYEVQVDLKTEAGQGFAAYFEVYGVPSLEHGREFVPYPQVTTTTGWERRSLRFRSGPATELVVYLRIQDGTGTAWFDNLTIKTARELPLVNVVETPDQPISVTNLDKSATYKPGADYSVEPGELRYPFTETAEPWRITRREGGAIGPQEEVLVSYEWAEPGDITYCPSEPRTQAIMRKAIAETLATFRPRLIHLGHDEPRVMNRDTRCRKRGMAAHELYVEDTVRMHQYVKQADPNCRVMMWADAFRVNAAGAVKVAWFSDEKCTLEDAVRNLPRDIIMCPWRYTETDADLLYRDLASLAAAGFDVTGSPWYDFGNAQTWGRATARLRSESDKCLAIFLTTWDDRWEALPLTSDLMWALTKPEIGGRGQELGEALKARYARFETFVP